MIDSTTNRRILQTALAAMVFAILACGQASAQDVFEATGIKVDESASDEVKAKLNAISDAQQRALAIVLKRLVRAADYGRLPKVTGQKLALMVRDYDIGDEKLGGGRYIATISVRFIPEEVSNLLKEAQIPFAITRSLPVVVLPVFDTGSTRRLWDDPNPWRMAWSAHMPYPGLFSVVMPAGDLSDVATVNVNQAIAADPGAMMAIGKKYNADGAMIAIASIGGSQASRTVKVTLNFVGGSYDGVTTERRYKGSGDLNAFLGQVVADLLDNLENDWKQQNILDFSKVERMSVLVPIKGLGSWQDIRSRLDRMSRIQSMTMARMTQEEIELDLVYVGSTEQLRTSLEQNGLTLEYAPDRPLWLLKRTGGN